MIIHLLRHADAENVADSDFLRALTPKGQLQAARVGAFLARIGEPIGVIITSPYLRALQTAQAVAEEFSAVNVIEDDRLRCGMLPQAALGLIKEYAQMKNILLVGHQPDLGILATTLLTRDRSLDVSFDKASVLTLEMALLSPASGALISFVRTEQM